MNGYAEAGRSPSNILKTAVQQSAIAANNERIYELSMRIRRASGRIYEAANDLTGPLSPEVDSPQPTPATSANSLCVTISELENAVALLESQVSRLF